MRMGVKTSIDTGGGDVEQGREMPVLEDPHHGAERRGEAQHVEQRWL